MLDLEFYMQFDKVLEEIKRGVLRSKLEVFEALERKRSVDPIIYNIETTNRCNMRCAMCPRTTMMSRKIEDIDMGLFKDIVSQIQPHAASILKRWESYCETKYGIREVDSPSENHFFLYIISKVIQLHGYGDPLLDRHMAEYVRLLYDAGFSTYFSCNPANIDLLATYKMFDAGLSYIKYSIESVSDEENRKIRGKMRSFSDSYHDILKVLDYKQRHSLPVTIVITMLNLNRKNQKEEFAKLREAFQDLDVYLYLKSEDCQWYRNEYHANESIHWSEPCKHPWMTMTIKSNGEAASCMEDYNNEIILGDSKTQSLKEIWNGNEYREFRKQHLDPSTTLRCNHRCDMELIGEFINR